MTVSTDAEPGTVNWLIAELMRFVVRNEGHLPVTLVAMHERAGTAALVGQVVGPDQDHPTIELWGQT